MRQPNVPGDIVPHIMTNVGFIVVGWSFLELHLAMWTAIIHADAGGSEIESELPRMSKRRIRYLRKCFNRIPALTPARIMALDLLDRASRLQHVRDFAVHGTMADYDPEGDEHITFKKIDVGDDKQHHVTDSLSMPGAAWVKAGADLTDMAKEAESITLLLLNTLRSEKQID